MQALPCDENMNTGRNSKQTTCLCRDTGGKGTLPAQHTTFNTLDNWAIKPPPNQKGKGPERKGYRVMARNMYTIHSVTSAFVVNVVICNAYSNAVLVFGSLLFVFQTHTGWNRWVGEGPRRKRLEFTTGGGGGGEKEREKKRKKWHNSVYTCAQLHSVHVKFCRIFSQAIDQTNHPFIQLSYRPGVHLATQRDLY